MPSPRNLLTLRLAVIGAIAGTLLITWPLWLARTAPPVLPLLEMPPPLATLPFGLLLLITLALALWRPLAGALTHVAVLTLAMLADQLREQPQMISLAVLLFATCRTRGAARVGAVHLVALWLWSGFGKLTSPTFLSDGAAWLLGLPPGTNSAIATTAAVALGLAEVTLALLAIVPRTRRFAAWSGALLHACVFTYLTLVRDANVAVWPWNLALAVAAPVLLGHSGGPLLGDRKLAGPLPRLAALAAAVLPLGFFVGVVDAPFAHQVYTMNSPTATWLRTDGRLAPQGFVPELGVLVPGVPRILTAWFEANAAPGERLVIIERRPFTKFFGGGDRLVRLSTEQTR